jgi:hypothetical protein
MADPETIQREHGCGCGVDVFGCLVHKIIIAGQAQPEEASCAPAVAHGPGAALGHDDAEDVRELLQVLCQRRGLPAPVYKVRPIRGATSYACACACACACAQWMELMVVRLIGDRSGNGGRRRAGGGPPPTRAGHRRERDRSSAGGSTGIPAALVRVVVAQGFEPARAIRQRHGVLAANIRGSCRPGCGLTLIAYSSDQCE